MENNKTGKHFKYAIGKIILVVIGILIGEQVESKQSTEQAPLCVRIVVCVYAIMSNHYDLHPCKSLFVPPVAFKFDPVKFSGTVQQLKNFVENIKQKIKRDISLVSALE